MSAADLPKCPIPSLAEGTSKVFLEVRSNSGVRSSWGVETRDALIFECEQTGMRFRAAASEKEIADFYKNDYHHHMIGGDESTRREAHRKENLERIAFLKRYCPGGRVLDIGCSAGQLAGQMQAAGYEVFGSDISADACREAGKVLGADRIFHGPIDSFKAHFDDSLDAIALMDVIEHFDDVVTPLRQIRGMLRKGGVLFLRTPTLSSPFYKIADWSYRLTGGAFTRAVLKIYHAEHFHFFNEKSISLLLGDTGYEVLSIEPDPLLWVNFRSAEMRLGLAGNFVLAATWFLGRMFNRGHGMKVVARRPIND